MNRLLQSTAVLVFIVTISTACTPLVAVRPELLHLSREIDTNELMYVSASSVASVPNVLAMPSPNKPSFFIVDSASGKCLDVEGEQGKTNGAKLQLWDCEFSGLSFTEQPTDQRWNILPDGLIQNAVSGKCIDVYGAPGGKGAKLQLWDCETSGLSPNGQPTDQRWTIVGDGFIQNNNSNSRCIDVEGMPGHTNGAQLQLWDCESSGTSPNGSNTDQKWELSIGLSDRKMFIPNLESGKCIDVDGAPGTGDGAELQLWDCEVYGKAGNGSKTDQIWEWTSDGFIKNARSGKCIDVYGAPGGKGAKLQLWDCEYSGMAANGSATDQQWKLAKEGQIKNILSGKCIDVYGTPGGKGAKLQLWDCEGATSPNGQPTDQKWVVLPPVVPLLENPTVPSVWGEGPKQCDRMPLNNDVAVVDFCYDWKSQPNGQTQIFFYPIIQNVGQNTLQEKATFRNTITWSLAASQPIPGSAAYLLAPGAKAVGMPDHGIPYVLVTAANSSYPTWPSYGWIGAELSPANDQCSDNNTYSVLRYIELPGSWLKGMAPVFDCAARTK